MTALCRGTMQEGLKPKIVLPDDIGASFKSSPNIARLAERAVLSVFNERPSNEADLIERIRTANIVLTFRPAFTRFPKHVLAAATDLRMICISGTGIEDVDVAEATARKIAVANVPGPSNRAVAEHCLALLFSVARHVGAQDRAIRRGEWTAIQGIELGGKTLGIVGIRGISSQLAPLAIGLGMEDLASRCRSPRTSAGSLA